MSKVTINGVTYAPVDEKEREELAHYLQNFTSEGEDFWRDRFQQDSAPGEWNAGMYGEGDEQAPFFTEAFLYNLLGKDDARSVLGITRRLCVLAGVEWR